MRLRWGVHAEMAAAAVLIGLSLITLVDPPWIEAALPIDPDAGSGGFELMVLAAIAAVSGAGMARRAWLRARARRGEVTHV